ncbi:type II secretion system GspH family protein [Pseudomonas stutzeri]|nr:type II secretion system GspH family protein [Stutzerimonas stutzeri]
MNRQRGVTLVELVIAIVIVGIAAAALYSAMASITARSADPMLRQQSLMLAEACLEEILGKPFAGLDGSDCTQARTAATAAGLGGYSITRRIEARGFSGISASNAWHVQIDVQDPTGQALTLSGWRTCYDEYDAMGDYACTP